MKTRISPKLEWLRPYLEIGIPFISKSKKITRLGHWEVTGRFGKREKAAIITNDDRKYRIYLKSEGWPRGQNPAPFSKMEMLSHLAHELSHTRSWKHTPRQGRLEAKIWTAFLHKLESDGYVSEEKELA